MVVDSRRETCSYWFDEWGIHIMERAHLQFRDHLTGPLKLYLYYPMLVHFSNSDCLIQAHDSAIRAFQFSHNGSYLVSTDQTGIIKYFQPNMNNLVMWNGHKEAIRGVAFSPDDARFATASDDQTIKLWDFQTRTEERSFTGSSSFRRQQRLSSK